MKGDPLPSCHCPLCHKLLKPRREWSRHQNGGTHTPQFVIRKLLYDHTIRKHPGMGIRERSLVLDRAVEALG